MKKLILHGLAGTAVGLLAVILLFYFSQPQRLAHDQIIHRWYMIANEKPQIFEGDYLLGTGKYKVEDNYYAYSFYKWLGKQIDPFWPEGGGDELARWVLVPMVFFVFTSGMYGLLYFFTKNFWVSLPVAILANVHIVPVFVAEWGLPGPTGLDPWTLVFAFYPLLFLGFYRGIAEHREKLVLLAFLGTGILGNLHILTTFYLVGIFILTYLLIKKISLTTLFRCGVYGIISVAASLPFLLKYASADLELTRKFDPQNPIFYELIDAIAPHVTLGGRLATLKIWLVDQWYFIWPGLLLICFIILYYRRMNKLQNERFFGKFSLVFIVSTLLLNATFSLYQIVRFYFLSELPMFNEPRGIQLMYIVFFISLVITLNILYGYLKPFVLRRKLLFWIMTILVVLAISYSAASRVVALSKQKTTPRFLFLTCDAEMYRRLNHVLKPQDVILVDPAQYSAIRVCTKHPVVVQSRDRGSAYDQGSDTALEWFTRFREVSKAFKIGGEELLTVAKKYNARVIVSRQCVEVQQEKLASSHKVAHPTLGHEGCIYILK